VVRLPPSRRLLLITIFALVTLVIASAHPALGQSSTSKKKQVERLQDELDRLDDELGALAEDANDAEQSLLVAQSELARATESAKESESTYEQSVRAAKAEALRRLVEGPTSSIDVGDSLQVNVRKRTYREAATGQRIDRIDALNAATEDFSIARKRAVRLEQAATQQKSELARMLKRTNTLADRQDALLRSAKSDVVKLLAQEETRRIQAEERAAKSAAAKRKAAAAKLLKERKLERERQSRAGKALRLAAPPTSSNVRGISDRTADPATPTANSDAELAAEAEEPSNLPNASGADLAVQVALAQVGKAYVWGAAGAETFDCSGLTGYAWRKAGKNLPRVSRAQYSATRRVSRSELQPGDLLFFARPGRPIHHVGMYIGNGQMVEAPHRRARVRVRSAFRRDYLGAGRVL
jgi:peptidoglycan DL-endopeptidase CwlO